MHEDKCFLTLTFNDENLPKNQSLDKKFISDFIKCLREDMRRKKLPKIRYFLCGEYGSICNLCGNGKKHCKCKNNTYTLGRPHYHAIIFGYDFADSSVLATLYKAQQDSLAIVGNMWKLGGNTGINDSTKFLGTTDKKALNFRVNGRRSGFIDSTSTNTIFGYGALQNVTSGLTNTVVGYEALKANTTGVANTAIGYRALYSNTTSTGNFAAGREALRSNTTGGNNFGMGFFALYSNVSGVYNIAIGNSALQNNTTSNNLAIGNNAALNNTTGSVVAVGCEALKANTTGLLNTAIGLYSLWSNTTSSNNTAIGAQALYYSTGQGNTAVGAKALIGNTTGQYNTGIGVNTLSGSTTTQGNTAIGNNALYSNGNTVTGLGAITGGSGYTNGTYTNVTMTIIPNVVASEYPVANITVSGGAVTAVTLVSGGAGVGQVTSLSATAAQIGGTGSGFSVLITSFNPGGNYSTAIGDSAAANQRRGNANIAVGPHVALPDTAAGKQLNKFEELPFHPEQLTRNLPKGEVVYYQGGGFTVLAIAGSCKDDRPETKSLFWVRLKLDRQEMIEFVKQNKTAMSIINAMPFDVSF